jgi:hypothetical protein
MIRELSFVVVVVGVVVTVSAAIYRRIVFIELWAFVFNGLGFGEIMSEDWGWGGV